MNSRDLEIENIQNPMGIKGSLQSFLFMNRLVSMDVIALAPTQSNTVDVQG